VDDHAAAVRWGNALAFVLGAYLYRAGTITIGTLYIIFYYTELLRQPIKQIRTQLQELQKADARHQARRGAVSHPLAHQRWRRQAHPRRRAGGRADAQITLLGLPEDAVDLPGAIHAAVLEQDIAALPEGLDTIVGARGVRLSGGQIQRAAAAHVRAQRRAAPTADRRFWSGST